MFRRALLAVGLAVGLYTPAQAAPILFDFAATVTDAPHSSGTAEFEAATGLDAAAFDVGDTFTGQVAIDLSLAGVDTATAMSASRLGPGGAPLVPPFVAISISDGVNTASPLTVPFAGDGVDADQGVAVFSGVLELGQDIDAFSVASDFFVTLTIGGIDGLDVLDDLVAGADFSNINSAVGDFGTDVGPNLFERVFDLTSFVRGPVVRKSDAMVSAKLSTSSCPRWWR